MNFIRRRFLPSQEAADRCRKETTERLPGLHSALEALLPDAHIRVCPPASYELAGTVYISILHTEDRRTADFLAHGAGAINLRLTPSEKIRIGEAVGKACSENGLEVLLKPKWSNQQTLCYRVWKETKPCSTPATDA